MNEEKYEWYNKDWSKSKFRILPSNLSSNDAQTVTMKIYKNRRGYSDEDKLERMNISTIERFLRKKKLEKLNSL